MRRLTADKRVLAVVALLGLLLVGLGAYAIFRETLTADIRVRTGTFNFTISSAVPQDNETQPNIADCTATVLPGGNTVRINITNAYPRYLCNITLTFINDGTIHGRFEVRDGPTSPASWLDVSYEDPQPNVQINPGGPGVTAKIIIKVKDGAPQNAFIDFQVSYTFRQFLPNP